MYRETKIAVNKAFEISKILFFMGKTNYNKLLSAVSNVDLPSKEETNIYIFKGFSTDDAMIYSLKDKYKKAAIDAGFTEEQGIAMLEYAAMLEEINGR